MSTKFDGPIPPQRGRITEIVRISSNADLYVFCLSERIYSVYTHWVNGRSALHREPISECPHCKESIPLRWRGYLCVISPPRPDAYFIELSEGAAHSICTAFVDRDSLRGSYFAICKTKGGLRGRFVVRPFERRIDPKTLPEAQTPEKVLEFLCSVKRS